jgi:hypothetical protein
LWIVGTALFVLAVAFVSYPSLQAEFIVAANKPNASSIAKLNDEVYRRFYSDMPREEFDKKISDPELIARVEAIVAKIDRSRPMEQWTDDELVAFIKHSKTGPAPSPWTSVGKAAAIAYGIPLIVLALGSSLLWALSGFAVTRN